MQSIRAGWALAALVLVTAPVAQANKGEKIVIKLGTLAPEGSVWHAQLRQMAEAWKRASNGQVVLRVFAGGVAGDEGDMVRKMRIGQLHAAALSAVGLHDIDGGPQLLALPGLIGRKDEWEHVYRVMQPRFEERLAQKGFVALGWADTGSVHLFVKRAPARTSDLKGVKVFAWAGDPEAVEAWREAGFQPVVISSTDMLTSLSTGMIEGFASTPIMAFASRWYQYAPNMVDSSWGHLPGATVITAAMWGKIPAELRPRLLKIARQASDQARVQTDRLHQESLRQMKRHGLNVVELSAEDQAAWEAIAQRSWAPFVREPDARKLFEEIRTLRDRYRSARK
jgi:TRAP-type C4-dicarboxylate transport system substrate-binding protein